MNADRARVVSILLVADNLDEAQPLATALQDQAYATRLSPNSWHAQRSIEEAPPPDVIVCSRSANDTTLHEPCDSLLRSAVEKDLPVIIIAGAQDSLTAASALGAGASDFIRRPFQFDELTARIERQLVLRNTRVELARRRARVQELEEARDGLVQTVVHDMRSALSALLAGGYFLRKSALYRSHAQHANDVDTVVAAGERLRRLADTLLDVCQLEAGNAQLELGTCDVGELVRAATKAIPRLEEERAVTIDASEPATVLCDKRLMLRAIENLMNAGLKQTPPGRVLLVSVSGRGDGVSVVVRTPEACAPNGTRTDAFERLNGPPTTLAARRQSLGIDLSLCQLVVEAHGGQVCMSREPASGQALSFTLPRQH